jgi:hypothetical protein
MVTFQDIESIASVALFSLLFPAAVLVGRHNIKKFRQRLLDDLERTYDQAVGGKSDAKDSNLRLVSSFEMARYKYDLPVTGEAVRSAWLYDLAIYLMPCFIYVVLCTLGFMNVVFPNASWAINQYPLMIGLMDWYRDAAAAKDYQIQTLDVVSVAFLGSYVWSVIYLLRRIANYDLSPLSFLRISAQILMACLSVAVVRHVVFANGANTNESALGGIVGTIFIGAAFIMGFYPRLGLDYLVDRFPMLKLKRIDPDASYLSRSLPLDMIDGMDTFITFRFGEMEIDDCQNLATANPILLFVESPYGLLEIADWVAQAQLITAVGPTKAKRLRDIAIRTIFDIEQAAQKASFAALIAEILFGPNRQTEKDEESVKAVVNSMVCSLHVQRLRQVWNAILVVVTPQFEGRPPKTSWPLMPLVGRSSQSHSSETTTPGIASIVSKSGEGDNPTSACASQREPA